MDSAPVTAADVMTRHPRTVDLDDTLKQVNHVFETAHCHHVVVMDGQRVMGVLSERDLLRALSPNLSTPSETERDVATLHKRAHQAMTPHPIVATQDTPLPKLVQAFRDHPIGCLPIVDEHVRLLGIVTWRDLLFAAYPAEG